jgi:hypothetical protein
MEHWRCHVFCNAKKSPRQILQGSFQPAPSPQAFFILVNTSTNTPILQHFITSSALHGVICSYSNPVPASSFAQYRHTVGHASTSHKPPSSKHRHCRLIDNALRSISIISMTTEPGTRLIEAFQQTKRLRRPSAFQILGQNVPLRDEPRLFDASYESVRSSSLLHLIYPYDNGARRTFI